MAVTHYEFHLSPSGPPVLVPRDIPSGEQVRLLEEALNNQSLEGEED